MTSAPETLTPSRAARRGARASGVTEPPPDTGDPQIETETGLVSPREATRAERWRERAEVLWHATRRVVRQVTEVVRPLGWVVLAGAVVPVSAIAPEVIRRG